MWAQVTSAFNNAWSGIKSAWNGVSGWFTGLWGNVKAAFNGGIIGISKLIVNWSPLGLFYKAFAGVMSWFGIDMPKNFTDFGGNLISGLVNGIGNKLSAAKDTIVNFGNSISGWFKETLGIYSPSRVFMGFGDNIGQGAAIGLQAYHAPGRTRWSASCHRNDTGCSPYPVAGNHGCGLFRTWRSSWWRSVWWYSGQL